MNLAEKIFTLTRTGTALGPLSVSASSKGLIRLTFAKEVEENHSESENYGWLEDALDQVVAFLQGNRENV